MRRLLLVALLVAVSILAGYRELYYPLRDPLAPPESLVIPQGASTDAIARELEAKWLVRHRYVFRLAVLLRGAQGRLRAGEYALEGPLSLTQIVDLLVRGEVVRHEATFPEGQSLEEMAEIAASHGLSASAFLAAAKDPAPIRDLDPVAEDLEGYLFPDTYDVPRGDEGPSTLVLRMVQHFRTVVGPDLP
ncbi:MAG TPA: endolytic transglycosylase MltG, partial [Vicinamibacteria bacterium]|nr:endolytic transglycosylase MltG [Vicinamibacteria bacterium]